MQLLSKSPSKPESLAKRLRVHLPAMRAHLQDMQDRDLITPDERWNPASHYRIRMPLNPADLTPHQLRRIYAMCEVIRAGELTFETWSLVIAYPAKTEEARAWHSVTQAAMERLEQLGIYRKFDPERFEQTFELGRNHAGAEAILDALREGEKL